MSTHTTRCAPADREPMEVVLRQRDALDKSKTTRLVDAVPQIVMVLNQRRQMVYCNRSLLQLLGLASADPILGQRPGEILDCVHAREMDAGCGTSEFCTQCGAVKAIMASLQGRRETRECHLLRNVADGVEAMDISVCATPFELDDERFAVFSVTDISHEKRRRTLERTFFHDILNLAGGLSGLLGLLAEDAPERLRESLSLLHFQSKQLVEEIISQKELMAAENNELVPRFIQLDGGDIIEVLAATYASHEVALGRRIAVEACPGDLSLVTDYNLLCRVLGNMLKNALEASAPGDTVTISCRPDGDGEDGGGGLSFSVRNPQAMPREVQLQIFSRSFSTKGADRGLGTFSMKLFVERYLGGTVGFTSNETDGTTFTVRLPRKPAEARPD